MNLEVGLPESKEVISRILKVPHKPFKMAMLYDFEICGRISEVVCRSYSSDKKTIARGPVAEDLKIEQAVIDKRFLEAAVFTVKTAKRKKKTNIDYGKGVIRKVALPLEYDPLAKILVDYFKEFGPRDFVFPFTRQDISYYVTKKNKTFEGLKCPIDDYVIYQGKISNQVAAHDNKFTLHSLRHLKSTDLILYHGFNGVNLAAYGGWSLQKNIKGFSKVMSRYVYVNWQAYFPKLLREPTYIEVFNTA